MMEYPLEDYILLILIIKILYEAGRAERILESLWDEPLNPEFYSLLSSEAFLSICDYADCLPVYKPLYNEEDKWLFSDERMLRYFRLTERYCSLARISLAQCRYFQDAKRENARQLQVDSLLYDFTFVYSGQTGMEAWFQILIDSDFNQQYALLYGLDNLFRWYAKQTPALLRDIQLLYPEPLLLPDRSAAYA